LGPTNSYNDSTFTIGVNASDVRNNARSAGDYYYDVTSLRTHARTTENLMNALSLPFPTFT